MTVSEDQVFEISANYVPADYGMNSWHLNPSNAYSTNVTTVWDEYKGAGVTVGVLDDGFDYLHSDLTKNYDRNLDYDFASNDANAYYGSGDAHGTAVAGVIAADDNGSGAVGIAPDATVAGYRISFGSMSLSKIGSIFDYAADHVDVFNNSWSFTSYFSDNIHTSYFSPVFDGIQNLAQNGRDGLGTLTVFSAGNSRTEGDNVNHHGMQNSPYTIAVGAVDSDGGYSSFSTPGASVLLSAGGSGIYTTDNSDAAGWTSGNYTYVAGTSFSAPIVSGVAALMLDANENLGYRDLQEILALSSWNSDASYSDWQENGATNWNGGGMHFSHQYGFGIVDAHAAVRLAETWTEQSTYNNAQTVTVRDSRDSAITDMGTVTRTLNVTQNIDIEHVLVDLTSFSHTAVGDLRITLTSPDGTSSVLLDRPGDGADASNYYGSQLTSVAHWGESSQGAWTLKIEDLAPEDSGFLSDWSLSFIGGASNNHDTYFYTKEFSDYYDMGRAVLDDTNGGVDTINASTLTSNSSIYLNAAAYSVVDGKNLNITDNTIENAYGGDGNDIIYGNSLDNKLYGMRGDDTIYAGDGNDFLDGGIGTDIVKFLYDISSYAISFFTQFEVILEGLYDGINTVLNFELYDFNGDVFDTAELYYEVTGNTLPIFDTKGNDTIVGGAGDDTISYSGGLDTIDGAAGSDTVDYSAYNQAIWLNLDISAEGGHVWTRGSTHVESGTWQKIGWLSNIEGIIGSDYNDLFHAVGGSYNFDGGDGIDTISYQFSEQTGGIVVDLENGTASGDGNDTITNFENIIGSNFSDRAEFALSIDSYNFSLGGQSVAVEANGSTRTYINFEYFSFNGDLYDYSGLYNHVNGASIVDRTYTDTKGNDTIVGGAGDDTISYSGGLDTIDGAAGSDTVDYSAYNQAIWLNLDISAEGGHVWTRGSTHVESGTWQKIGWLSNIEGIIGSDYNDLFHAVGGSYNFDGGDGIDTISYQFSEQTGGIVVDLENGTASGDGNDTITNFENIIGSNFSDVFISGNHSSSITGNNGADRFIIKNTSKVNSITDFDINDGDVLDFSDVLNGYDPLTDLLEDFVKITDNGKDSKVFIDQDGNGQSFQFAHVLNIENVTGLSDEDLLLNSGNIII